jgi:hypothetical protein
VAFSSALPLLFFRNLNNSLPFHFPLLGQRPVPTVKICLKHPAGVNSLSFQHSSILFAFLYFSCYPCLISQYLVAWPFPQFSPPSFLFLIMDNQ